MKNIFFLLLIICSHFTLAQKFEKAEILFSNGNILEGYANIGNSQVEFKKDIDGRKIVYQPLGIKSVFVYSNNEKKEYRFKKFKNEYLLMLVVIDGYVSLLNKGYGYTSVVRGGNLGTGFSNYLDHYFLCRGDNLEVTRIMTKGKAIDKSFKKTAVQFFKDCPDLVTKLDDKIFKREDIEKVVLYYNEDCTY